MATSVARPPAAVGNLEPIHLSGTPSSGLTEQEARRRADAGLANTIRETTSRSVPDILKANLLTRFNALLGTLFVATLVVGPIQDAVMD